MPTMMMMLVLLLLFFKASRMSFVPMIQAMYRVSIRVFMIPHFLVANHSR